MQILILKCLVLFFGSFQSLGLLAVNFSALLIILQKLTLGFLKGFSLLVQFALKLLSCCSNLSLDVILRDCQIVLFLLLISCLQIGCYSNNVLDHFLDLINSLLSCISTGELEPRILPDLSLLDRLRTHLVGYGEMSVQLRSPARDHTNF